ncbi:MAG: hypothetical protein JWO90_2313 [Solirubrobacterales bacterium]|nr:hypothetical protein [Solirubrobacterales bacterium]
MFASWVLLPVVLLALSAGCGLAITRAAGGGVPRPLVLPLGFAGTVVLAGLATASAATAGLAAPLVLAVAVTGFLVAPDRLAWVPDRWAALAALGVYLVFGAPVLASGSASFTGYIQLDDIATWLAMTDQVFANGRDFSELGPSSHRRTLGEYLPGGYPVGAFLPLGLGSEFLLGRDIIWLFAPTMALTSALLALTLTSIVTPLLASPLARAAVAFVAAQSGLLVAYAEWGAIKEVTAALLVALTAALAPTLVQREVPARNAARRALPLAVAIAATVAALSFGGGVWVAPVVVIALLGARAHPRALLVSAPALAVGVLVLSIPSLVLIDNFYFAVKGSGSVLRAPTELGNLRAPLPFEHLLGIWPAGDFRSTPKQAALTNFLLTVLVIVGAAGLAVALQRRAGALLAYTAGGVLACAFLVSRGSPWVDAKAMATASPMVLTAGLALLGWIATERYRGAARALAVVAFAALATGVLWSNVLGYANSYVAPAGQIAELEAAGDRLAGQGPTLMTEYEPYGVRHLLRKADGEGASELRDRLIPLRDGSQLPKSASADITAFDPAALREYRSLVLRTGPFTSRPPSAYARIEAGTSYDVWQRPAAPPEQPVSDLPLGVGGDPGAVPDCSAVRRLAQDAGPGGRLVAVARETPVVLPLGTAALSGGLEPHPGDPRFVVPKDDGSLTADVSVPSRGDYAVWLGGSTRGRTTVRIDGRETGSVRGRLNNQEGTMRFGLIRLPAGAHRVEITYSDGGPAPGQRGQDSQPLVLGPLALAPREAPLEPFSVRAADAGSLCGRHLDWIEAHAG